MRAGSPRRSRRAYWAWALLLIVLLGACARDLPQTTLDPAGPVAEAEDDLWDIVFPIAVGVFILVQGAIIFAVVKFRARPDDDSLPRQVSGNTKLEVIWTIIPALILAGVAVPTIQTIFELSGEPDDALRVRVVAKQYWWEFEYLDEEGQNVVTATELHIPTGRPVYLQMQSLSAVVADPGFPPPHFRAANGVIHSFWVPKLAGKQDVVPGHVRELSLEADEPGVYPGQCAEFCGLSHARMRFWVWAQEPDDFQAWLDEQAEDAVEEFDSELAQRGQELVSSPDVGQQCIQCHAIAGYESDTAQEAQQRIGPNLTHFASRETFAGGFLPINEENLQAWLADPQAVKPGAQMPDLGLTEDQIEALTAYLLRLE